MISSKQVKALAFVLSIETSTIIIEERTDLIADGLVDLLFSAIQSSFLIDFIFRVE